jgi:DNA-binding NarL/FixJ family response regulator
MSDTSVIRVLAVDDHPLIRDGIAFALQGQPNIQLVGEAKLIARTSR